MDVPEKITEEYLEKLPIIAIKPREGVTGKARYDAERKILYMLDENGNYTGKYGPADVPTQKLAGKSEAHLSTEPGTDLPENSEDTAKEHSEKSFANTEKTSGKEFFKRNKKKIILGAVCVAVIIAGIVCGRVMHILNSQEGSETKETQASQNSEILSSEKDETTATEATTSTTAAVNNKNTVTVLTARKTLLPGHTLSSDDFLTVTISEADYLLLDSINGVYTKAEIDVLKGQTVLTYLSAGSYVGYDDVGPTYAPVNPWRQLEKDQSTVIISVEANAETLKNILWGNQMDIQIQVQTKYTSSTSNDNTEEGTEYESGVNHSSSVIESTVVDTYICQNAVIIDVLDSNKKSLFTEYSMLTEIPFGYRTTQIEKRYYSLYEIEKAIPCFIEIAVSSEEAEIIKALDTSNMTITLGNAKPYAKTELQSDTYTALQAVGSNILSQWKALST